MAVTTMLAYTFWHWPRHGIDPVAYEQGLVSFQEALGRRAPAGFVGSAVFRVRDAPWAGDGLPAYEDWYLLEGSAALDVINDAAVSGACQARHDSAALHAAGGAAGLYRLREGALEVRDARVAHWLRKPEGVEYAEFYDEIAPQLDDHTALWSRQMVLGPTPEFCLMARQVGSLPFPVSHVVPHELVWASG
jgi:hypothetical protein